MTFTLQCHQEKEVHRDYAGSLIANCSWSMNCLIANESWFGFNTPSSKTLQHVSFHKLQVVYVIILTLSVVACPSGSPTCCSTNALLKLHHYVARVELIGAICLGYERVLPYPPKLIWHRSSLKIKWIANSGAVWHSGHIGFAWPPHLIMMPKLLILLDSS